MTGALRLVEIAHLSDVGRVRPHNEDRSLASAELIAVADGMGGAQAGEVAAEMAVEAVGQVGPGVGRRELRGAIERANREIRRMADRDPDKTGMGTTITAATVEDGRLSVLHVGDSRAYLWRGGELRQLTQDHSVVAELVRRGTLSAEEAENHPHRNVITRALGAEPEVEVDSLTQALESGDVVLICSDGLSSYVTEPEIAEALAGADGLGAAARDLVARANGAGGIDNVTVVLARVGLDAEAAPARQDTESTAEHVRPEDMGGPGATAEMRVLGGTRGHQARAGGKASAPPPRVLERVSRRRRSRARPAALVVAAVLVAAVAVVSWIASRTYTLETGPGGEVRVAHGLPLSIGGLDLHMPWQETGVPAATVRAADPQALGGTRGQGEVVELAARLVWTYGLPEVPRLEAADSPSPPAPAGGAVVVPGGPDLPPPQTPATP